MKVTEPVKYKHDTPYPSQSTSEALADEAPTNFVGISDKIPIRKRKKNTEASDQAAGKLSRRKVDKALLEIPEDERDFTQIPLRDLIFLADHKEQALKKAAKTPTSVNDDEEESFSLVNYHTHMDETPRLKWSPQDTKLFYEGLRQFGSDLSMILLLFPGKTRRQMKLKYKHEERQHPERLNEALSNSAKDYSHFHEVIECLKESTDRADSVSLTGEEETEEELVEADETAETENVGGNENMIAEGQNVVETCDETSDDDFWYGYKSEL